MAYGIRDMRLHHKLRFRRGAGGEIELHGVAGASLAIRLEIFRRASSLFERMPTCYRTADHNASTRNAKPRKLRGGFGAADDVTHAAALNAVSEIVLGQQGGGGDDHTAKFDQRQCGLPQFGNVAEHDQDGVTAFYPES